MRCKVRSEVTSADSSATSYEDFDWDFNRRNQTCRYREKLVWMSTWILIEEIEHLFLEKWSDWKSSFFETNGNFSAPPVYHDSDTKEKCKDFSMEYLLQKKDFDTELDEKTQACFFGEKWVATSMNFNTVCAFPQCENSKVFCCSRYNFEQIFLS